MRLKKKALALVVAIMIIATVVVSYQMLAFAHSFKIGYVTAEASQTSFVDGEDVSFTLRSLTPDVPYSIGTYMSVAGVYVCKVPQDRTPGEYLHDLGEVSYFSTPPNYGFVPFTTFNSTDAPMTLHWNGTYAVNSIGDIRTTYYKATAGDYILFPLFNNIVGGTVKPVLSTASIFHYDSMQVELKVTAMPDLGSFRTNISLSGWEGMIPATGCHLECSERQSGGVTWESQNFTIDLNPASWVQVDFVPSIQGFGYGGELRAVLSTPTGDYVFGANVNIHGGDMTVMFF